MRGVRHTDGEDPCRHQGRQSPWSPNYEYLVQGGGPVSILRTLPDGPFLVVGHTDWGAVIVVTVALVEKTSRLTHGWRWSSQGYYRVKEERRWDAPPTTIVGAKCLLLWLRVPTTGGPKLSDAHEGRKVERNTLGEVDKEG